MSASEGNERMPDEGRTPPRTLSAPTLEDVARAAGVSRQTVSNALSAPERVRPETRARVLRFVAELGYHPNRLAQAFRVKSSGMVAYRIKPLASHALGSFHDRFLHALSEAGQAAGRQVLLFTAADVREEVETCSRLHRSGAVDAVVIYDVEDHDLRPGALLALDVPFVAFGRTRDGADRYTWVDVDNAAGMARAVEQLVGLDHRRIGFVGMPPGHTIGDRRADGWREAMRRHALEADLILQGSDSVSAGVDMTSALLSRPEAPTAIVAATDTLAVGTLRASGQVGLRPGTDLAVIGFDDSPTATALELSSIRQPVEEVAQTVMARLLSAGTQPPSGSIKVPWLMARASSAYGPGRRPHQ